MKEFPDTDRLIQEQSLYCLTIGFVLGCVATLGTVLVFLLIYL